MEKENMQVGIIGDTQIEERAWNSAVARMQGDSYYALGYKEGATEQKAVDDAEFTKLKKELLLATTFAVKAKEKEMVDKACEWLENWAKATEWYTIGESIEMLRKAMEE